MIASKQFGKFITFTFGAMLGLLFACSGGGGNNNPPAVAAPSNLVYSTNPAVYTKGVAITANNPSSSGGAVVSYAVSPALPAGLSQNTGTGVISGTPTAIMGATSFTVTATNSGGFTTATLSMTVNDVAPSIAYGGANPTFPINVAIAALTPTNSGGPVVSWAITPQLPAGLAFNTTNGTISGTPTALSLATTYTVTATNSGGSHSVTLTIAVVIPNAPPTITTQPLNATAMVGATASFSVAAVANPQADPLTYQWQVNKGAGFANVTGGDGSGGSAANITTVATTLAMSGYLFQCVVTDGTNGLSATSGSATLTVNPAAPGPLKVAGRFLQDANGANVMMRGVNVPVFKSGYADDLNAVAAAIATTKVNVVRLEWWANPPMGADQYTVANLDRAIQKYVDLGILPIIELHDLTFQFGHDAKAGPNSDGNDQALFAATITAYWTRADVVPILVKHRKHLVINLANEWGSSAYSDATSTAANFIQNYTNAITAMRAAGVDAPLMVDAPKGFEYQFILDQGQAILDSDPQHNVMLSIHAYWAAVDYPDGTVTTILNNILNSGLPIILGEVSSNAYTAIPCDPIHYPSLLATANANLTGYLFWAWYEDGQCGQNMNITVGADGVTVPTAANPGFGYDAIFGAGYGINTAIPATAKVVFN